MRDWGVFIGGRRIDRPEQPRTGDYFCIPDDPALRRVALDQFAPRWRQELSTIASDVDFSAVENAVFRYIRDRAEFVHGLSIREVKRGLELARDGLVTLMRAIDDFGDASQIARIRIAHAENPPLDWDDMYPVVSLLRRRVELALAEEIFPDKPSERAFRALVYDLAAMWHARPGKPTPTAAKSGRDGYAAPSPFVKFVHSAIKFAPEHLREHQHSMGALAKAINNALLPWRRDFFVRNDFE